MLAAGTSSGGGGLLGFLPLVLIGGVFLLLVSRNNRKRQAGAARVQSALEPGAEVVTTSGMYGTVRAVDDDDVSLEIAPGVVVLFARAAVARVVAEEAIDPDQGDPDGPPVERAPGLDSGREVGRDAGDAARRVEPGDAAA